MISILQRYFCNIKKNLNRFKTKVKKKKKKKKKKKLKNIYIYKLYNQKGSINTTFFYINKLDFIHKKFIYNKKFN